MSEVVKHDRVWILNSSVKSLAFIDVVGEQTALRYRVVEATAQPYVDRPGVPTWRKGTDR